MSATGSPVCDPAKIRARRLTLGLRQVQVAEAAGINQGYLSLIERGVRSPSADMLGQVARALGCTPADLAPAGGDAR